MKKTCRGWSSGGFSLSGRDVYVNVRGVCTCSWHKKCVKEKRCLELFGHGEVVDHQVLAGLMGLKKVPKSWGNWRNFKAAGERLNARERFSKEFFKRCRPVRVTVEKVCQGIECV